MHTVIVYNTSRVLFCKNMLSKNLPGLLPNIIVFGIGKKFQSLFYFYLFLLPTLNSTIHDFSRLFISLKSLFSKLKFQYEIGK